MKVAEARVHPVGVLPPVLMVGRGPPPNSPRAAAHRQALAAGHRGLFLNPRTQVTDTAAALAFSAWRPPCSGTRSSPAKGTLGGNATKGPS
jgi:hypothetical protein